MTIDNLIGVFLGSLLFNLAGPAIALFYTRKLTIGKKEPYITMRLATKGMVRVLRIGDEVPRERAAELADGWLFAFRRAGKAGVDEWMARNREVGE